jgi:hypothetical protein
VIFDSTVLPGTGQAVYMSAAAEELVGDDVVRGLESYPGPPDRGARTVTVEELRAPGPTASIARERPSTGSSTRMHGPASERR